jgi:alpha-tubulin suppressor-like RCC1 family protein
MPRSGALLAVAIALALASSGSSWGGSDSSATAIASGGGDSCALLAGHGLECWGFNAFGELGDGTTRNRTRPVAVSGLSSGVRAVALGANHSCALLRGGRAKCWGNNYNGELGNGTTKERHIPVAVSRLASGARAISPGTYFTCGLGSGGRVECWGANDSGQLGDGTTTDRHTPVAVSGLARGFKSIGAGDGHACALGSGGVECWGSNGSGQLGDGSNTDSSIPVAVSGLVGVQAIAVGGAHNCVLGSGGGVECWGANDSGRLGDGTTTDRDTPVAVSGLQSGVRAIAAGESHTCALLGSGGVVCWGENFDGALGDGTTKDRLTPVRVKGLGR